MAKKEKSSDFLGFLNGRVKTLHKEIKALGNEGEKTNSEIKRLKKGLDEGRDKEKFLEMSIDIREAITTQAEIERQFTKTVEGLKELVVLQETFDKREDNQNIYDEVKSYPDNDIFVIEGGEVKGVEGEYKKIKDEYFEKTKANLLKEAEEYFDLNNK